MERIQPAIREFQLGEWRVQPQLHQLVGPSGPVTVEARSMEVLVALAEQAGEVVSRSELLDLVWGDLFVSEQVLTHAVWDLRRALGDDPALPEYIQTLPKRGFRLLAPVSWLEDGVGETGRYRLGEKIGGGAMGVVFRAEDTRLQRTVALKFLPPEWGRDEVAKKRFLREARTAAALDHPNLCTLLEIDETDDGRLFLVMPFYRGETLKETLTRGALTRERAIAIALQIAAGLEALHHKGIIHRDIKPGNILLVEEGETKILDFGLAKFAGATRVTRTETSPGTPAYMSPQQVQGEEAEPRSDVWSLGAVLYEMLSGRPPFGGENEHAIFYSILHREPEPLGAAKEVPEELARIVSRALIKDREGRYPAIGAMASDLVRVGVASSRAASAPPARGGATESASRPEPREAPHEGPQLASFEPAESGDIGEVEPPTPVGPISEQTPGSRPRRRLRSVVWQRRGWLLAGLVALVLLVAGGWWLEKRGSQVYLEPLDLDPRRVVVLPFENRTGEASLDGLSLMAAELIAHGVARTGRVEVVPVSDAAHNTRMAEASGRPREDLPSAVGRATGSGTAIRGWFYSMGDALQFGAEAVDLIKGRLIRSLDPVTTARDETESAIGRLRGQLMTVVAWTVDQPELPIRLVSHVPFYEAYQEYWVAVDIESWAEWENTQSHLLRSLELDPDFVVPKLVLFPMDGTGTEERIRILEELDARRLSLSAFERRLADAFRAGQENRPFDRLNHLRELAGTVPENGWINMLLVESAVSRNRPQEALDTAAKLPYENMQRPAERWWRFIHQGYALHMLGRYEEELKLARWARDEFPSLPTEPMYAEARALGALGRVDELQRLIDDSEVPPDPFWKDLPGAFAIIAAGELTAHGYPESAPDFAERALLWYRKGTIFTEEPERTYPAQGLADALLLLGRCAEGYETVARALADRPDSIGLRGHLGVLAACKGDHREALRISEEFAGVTHPSVFGISHFWRALIAAYQGDLEDAVELLAEALNHGFSYSHFAASHELLIPLLEYPPYQKLIRPQG